MDIYSPLCLGLGESEPLSELSKHVAEMNVPDSRLEEYVSGYIGSYRKTVEEFFPRLAGSISFYSTYPFTTTAVRMGLNGVIFAYRPNSQSEILVRRFQDFAPPFASLNLNAVLQRLQARFCRFDFTLRNYDKQEAHLHGVRDALNAVLEHFWTLAVPDHGTFEAICMHLLTAEGIIIGQGESGETETERRMSL